MPGRTRARLLRPAAVALAAGLLLAGCGGTDDSGEGASAPEAASQGNAGSDAGAGGGSGSGGDDGGAAQVKPGGGSESDGGASSPQQREVVAGVAQAAAKRVRTAQVTVEVTSLETSAAVVRQIATDLGGIIGSETTGFGAAVSQPAVPGSTPGPNTPSSAVAGEAVIVLRVPEPKLDEALLRVSKVGEELTRTSSSDDVTARIADLESRVATQRKSLERVRALLGQATSLQEIVTIEAELTRREADLESLQAQQRALGDQAALATLTAILRLPDAKPSTSMPDEEDDTGFLAGLRGGWEALSVSTTVVLTILGALLPPALVFAVIGVPLWLLWRRFRPEPRPRPGRPRSPGPRPPLPPAPMPQPATPAPGGGPAPGPPAP
jgi:hypothetical protein